MGCTDGEIAYAPLDAPLDFHVPHIAKLHNRKEEDVRKMLFAELPKLNHWAK